MFLLTCFGLAIPPPLSINTHKMQGSEVFTVDRQTRPLLIHLDLAEFSLIPVSTVSLPSVSVSGSVSIRRHWLGGDVTPLNRRLLRLSSPSSAQRSPSADGI